MSFESELYDYLVGQTALTDEVSTRIYPSMAPQREPLPFITFLRIGDATEHHFAAASALSTALFQFDIWALTNVSRDTVAEALRNELDGFSGFLKTAVDVRWCHLTNEADTAQLTATGTEDQDFRTTQDYEFVYIRSVPTF